MKERTVWIEEDLTWNERRTRWKLRLIMTEKALKDKRLWTGKIEVSIEGKWWRWDEDKEMLVSEGGDTRGAVGAQGEGK